MSRWKCPDCGFVTIFDDMLWCPCGWVDEEYVAWREAHNRRRAGSERQTTVEPENNDDVHAS